MQGRSEWGTNISPSQRPALKRAAQVNSFQAFSLSNSPLATRQPSKILRLRNGFIENAFQGTLMGGGRREAGGARGREMGAAREEGSNSAAGLNSRKSGSRFFVLCQTLFYSGCGIPNSI